MTRAHFPLFSLLAFLLVPAAAPPAAAQEEAPWYRRPGMERQYDLSGRRILVVAAQAFNYPETVEMAECWRRWGATVEFAAPEVTVTAEREAMPGAEPPAAPQALRADHLVADADPSRYDAVYFAGGEGVGPFLDAHRAAIARLVEGVYGRGKVVSAICHGPLALSAAPAVIKGRRLTVQGTAGAAALERAGAVLVTETAVVDGRLVTGQWPHLEEFAATLAERLQYPGGGGPREQALAARTPGQRAVDDLRDTYAFENRPVPAAAVAALARAAQKAVAARTGRGPRAVRYVAVEQAATKEALAQRLSEAAREAFVAMGMPEAIVRAQVGRMLEGAPLLLFQFVEAPAAPGAGPRDPMLRADTAFAGAAASSLAIVARSLGLGVSMIGMPAFLGAEDGIREILQVPGDQLLVGILGVGYPAAGATPAAVRPQGEVFFTGRWPSSGERR